MNETQFNMQRITLSSFWRFTELSMFFVSQFYFNNKPLEKNDCLHYFLSMGRIVLNDKLLENTFETMMSNCNAIFTYISGILAIVGAMLAAFVIALRKGYLQPVRQGLRAVSVQYRKSRFARGVSRVCKYYTINLNKDNKPNYKKKYMHFN